MKRRTDRTVRFALNDGALQMLDTLDNPDSRRIVRGPMINFINNVVFATEPGTRPHGIRASRLRAVPVTPNVGATMR